jgi:excisionase family DNA binding protein
MSFTPTNILLPKSPEKNLLNNKEAAAYIGVLPKTLEIWRCTKRYPIPFIKVGRLVKYRKSDLDAFLDQRTIGKGEANV